jgi:hypothetical protein
MNNSIPFNADLLTTYGGSGAYQERTQAVRILCVLWELNFSFLNCTSKASRETESHWAKVQIDFRTPKAKIEICLTHECILNYITYGDPDIRPNKYELRREYTEDQANSGDLFRLMLETILERNVISALQLLLPEKESSE